MHRPMTRRSAAGVLALSVTIAAPATAAPDAGPATGVVDTGDTLVVSAVSRPNARVAIIEVTLEDGARLTVNVRPFDSYARISVGNLPGEGGTIDFRTGHVAPGQWHSLGTYDVTDAYAEVTHTVGGGTVRADAVRFSPSPS